MTNYQLISKQYHCLFHFPARNNTARKITAIVEKEFSQEIDQKHKEILQIQEKLHKCLKILHLLRYVIITNFYNNKQCELPQDAEANKQTRIHPAVQTLLSKVPKFLNCTEPAVPSTSTDPRFLSVNESSASKATDLTVKEKDADKCNGELAGKRKLPADELRPRKVPRYVPPKSSVPENNARPSRGDRHKVYKRIIVGNISKWIPPDWRDNSDASHKWTMYVRGDKDAADISTYVSKVRFFLHPSYCPNDVVEVTSHPFHLSRRGWGEFPLRVQLHFKNVLNKPMDIIHHLKLDRTYTGLQTLGSETLVDMWIHTADSRTRDVEIVSKNESVESPAANARVKEEPPSDGDSRESVRAESSTLQFTEDVFEKIRVKSVNRTLCESFDLVYKTLLDKESADVKVETLPDDATRAVASSVLFSVSTNESHLDTLFSIEHDHAYTNKQYYKPRCIIREGNITIEHVPDNEALSATDLSAVDTAEEKPDSVTIMSQRHNGDIQSSSDSQSLTDANLLKDTIESKPQALRLSSGYTSSRENDADSQDDDESSSGISEDISSKDATTINGFCKSSDIVFDRLKNLQRTAGVNNSHLKPLEISIPPSFAPSANKRILLVKDKKLIPVDVVRKTLADGGANPVASSNTGIVPQGVSILKKPIVCSAKASAKNNEASIQLSLKHATSMLLNVNPAEPALKIADMRDPRYNYSQFDDVKSAAPSLLPLISSREGAKSADKDEKMTQRTRITLGKDKYKLQSKGELYQTVLREIDSANITDTEAIMRFVVRRLPIVTQHARDPEYRRLHPYACCSEEDFFTLNIGKQRALEWHRAKMVKSYLRKKMPQDDRLWSVKEILMWTRLHGYTPSRSILEMSEVDATSSTKKLLDSSASSAPASTYTEPVALHKWLRTCQQESSHHRPTNDCDDEINVEIFDESPCGNPIDRGKDGLGDSTVESSTLLTPLELEKKLMPLHRFVCDTAQEIGIKIAPEEIVPGVVCCAASRTIMKVEIIFVLNTQRLNS